MKWINMIEVNSKKYMTSLGRYHYYHYWYFIIETRIDKFNIQIRLNQHLTSWNVPFTEHLRNVMFHAYTYTYVHNI